MLRVILRNTKDFELNGELQYARIRHHQLPDEVQAVSTRGR
jgi:hypothetical protein